MVVVVLLFWLLLIRFTDYYPAIFTISITAMVFHGFRAGVAFIFLRFFF